MCCNVNISVQNINKVIMEKSAEELSTLERVKVAM